MKTKFILSFAVLAMTLSSFSQIKLFSGGTTVFGDVSNTVSYQKFTFIGNTTFLSSNSSITSAPFVRGNNAYSSATTPDFTWWGNDQTGFFHPTANVIGFTINGSEKMRLTSTGNLLIGGTTDLSNRLVLTGTSNQAAQSNWVTHTSDYGYCQANHVNRSLTKAYSVISSATGSEIENFIVYGSGVVNANGYYSISDQTMKENIDSLQNALSKIKQLKGVKYNLKQSVTGLAVPKTELGLIAQDVEIVVPEVVITNDKGIKCIAYQNLVGLLIEAIKEQDKHINQLQNDLISCCTQSSQRIMNPVEEKGDDGIPVNKGSYIKQNVPNPFNKETSIEYFIAEKSAASSILIFDMNGKLLKTYKLNGNGQGSLNIVGNELSPGMYYYSLIVNAKEVGTKKMILTE